MKIDELLLQKKCLITEPFENATACQSCGSESSGNDNTRHIIIHALTVVFAVLLGGIILCAIISLNVYCWLKKKSKHKRTLSMRNGAPVQSQNHLFTSDEIDTNNSVSTHLQKRTVCIHYATFTNAYAAVHCLLIILLLL